MGVRREEWFEHIIGMLEDLLLHVSAGREHFNGAELVESFLLFGIKDPTATARLSRRRNVAAAINIIAHLTRED